MIMEDLSITRKFGNMASVPASAKPALRCYRCSTAYHYKVRRGWFIKNVLFFVPIKIYFCPRCVKNRYVIITTKAEGRYKPV